MARARAAGDRLGMARERARLEHDLAVPVEPEPAQPVDDRVDCLLRRARAVGVLDAQPEHAAHVARKSQLNSAVRAPPICRKPVGEGAKRTTTLMVRDVAQIEVAVMRGLVPRIHVLRRQEKEPVDGRDSGRCPARP